MSLWLLKGRQMLISLYEDNTKEQSPAWNFNENQKQLKTPGMVRNHDKILQQKSTLKKSREPSSGCHYVECGRGERWVNTVNRFLGWVGRLNDSISDIPTSVTISKGSICIYLDSLPTNLVYQVNQIRNKYYSSIRRLQIHKQLLLSLNQIGPNNARHETDDAQNSCCNKVQLIK